MRAAKRYAPRRRPAAFTAAESAWICLPLAGGGWTSINLKSVGERRSASGQAAILVAFWRLAPVIVKFAVRDMLSVFGASIIGMFDSTTWTENPSDAFIEAPLPVCTTM